VVNFKLFVEGGGNHNRSLSVMCREGFRKFIQKSGYSGSMPKIVACGGRQIAYEKFQNESQLGNVAFLLVDSEELVDETNWEKPWAHLAAREGDNWQKPENAEDNYCHLMVICMESWFLADRTALKAFFGQGFNEKALPAGETPLESIPKDKIYSSLEKASHNCKTKKVYGKSEHSFKLLGLIDPGKVTAASKWAKRFVNELKVRNNA
jgi:hypothetical protein